MPNCQALMQLRMYSEDAPLNRKETPLQYWSSRVSLSKTQIGQRNIWVLWQLICLQNDFFSKAGEIVFKKPNSLKGKNVQKVLFSMAMIQYCKKHSFVIHFSL